MAAPTPIPDPTTELKKAELKFRQAIWVAVITASGTLLGGLLGGYQLGKPRDSGQVSPAGSSVSTAEFHKQLQTRDALLFNGVHAESYEVARIYPNRTALESGGFSEILAHTNSTLDIAVISGHTILGNDFPAIEQALANPTAKVRIVLFDVSPGNQSTCDALAKAQGRTCQEFREDAKRIRDNLKGLHDRIRDRTGRLQVHIYPNVLLYTIWVKDAGESSAMALLRVHMLQDRKEWPSFAVSKDGAELIQNLSTEFQRIWTCSAPVDLDQPVDLWNQTQVKVQCNSAP